MNMIKYMLFACVLLLANCTPKTGDNSMKTKANESSTNVAATDQEFRKTAPEAAKAKKVNAGEFKTFELSNGLKVILVENHKIPMITYSLRVDRKPLYEGKEAGLTTIAGEVISSGTTNRTKSEINEDIDFVGGNLSTYSTGIYVSGLKKHQDVLLDVMTDVLYNASFPVEEFEKEKKKLKSSIASNSTDPDAISSNITSRALYGKDHPYGEIITKETIENISLQSVKDYYKKYFIPNISYLVIVGDISLNEAKEVAEENFGKWKKGSSPTSTIPKVEIPRTRNVVFVDKPGAVQSSIKIGNVISLKPNSEDLLAAEIANAILGGGIFSGYLMQNLREDKAYTYGARSRMSQDEFIGNFQAYADVRNEVTDSAVVEFLRELNRIRTEVVKDDALQLTKNSMAGEFARALESPQQIANQALNIAKFGLPKDYYDTYLQRLEAVTKEDVLKAAKKYIRPNDAYIVIVGSKAEVADKLKRFDSDGELTFLDAYGNVVSGADKKIPASVTAQSVIDNYIKSIGGKSALKNVISIEWDMSAEIQGQKITGKRVILPPNKFYESQTMSGMVLSETIYNGTKAVMKSPQGKKELTDEEELAGPKESALGFPELYYAENNYKLTLEGIETIDGKDQYRIKVESPQGEVVHKYYDVDSGLLTRTISKQEAQGRVISIISSYDNYTAYKGVKMPGVIKISGALPVVIELKTDAIKINETVNNTIFKID